ncbi:MAG: hypothetical protein Q9198_001057 [Flavoplaca austrocitrina]
MPLVISAIEHYRDALDPLKDYLKYHCALKLLRTNLNIEQTLFRETLESLLVDQVTPDQRRSLFPEGVQNVNITLWGTDEIQQKLQARLGSKFTNFTDLVGEMESVMKSLMKSLGIEPNWKSSSETIVSAFRKGDREWRKLKWSFGRKRREALLLRFEKCNQTLEKYVKKQEVPAPSQTSRSDQLARYLQKVRDHACKIHDALEDSWKCRRSCSHVANLELERRSSEVMTPLFDRPSSISGTLNDPCLQERIAITMFSPAEPTVIETVSLDRLIAANKSAPPYESPCKLSGQQRLGIAVTLAHTVLQLYDSPWLSESWSKNDILFFIPGHDGHKRPNIQRPYISRLFHHGPGRNIVKAGEGPCSRTDLYSHLITNKTLFALGIVLIELALETSFEDLCTKMLTFDGRELNQQISTVEMYQVATSLIDEVYDKQGTQYGYVVQRCLRCEFGFYDSEKLLEVDSFRAAVCEGVLAPLGEDLKRYSLPDD